MNDRTHMQAVMRREDRGFLDVLAHSRLLSPAELSDACAQAAQFGRDAVGAATRLADLGLLTHWQSLQLLAGRTSFSLGPYRLLERIGSGGAATIYKARHIKLGSTVALKVLSAGEGRHPLARARFRREIRAAAAVKHAHIVSTYGGQCVGGVRFLAMEFIDGEDLDRWLKRFEALPLAWCCEVARQVALGLEHIHQNGIVHRDIKPNNILLVARPPQAPPLVKIADLGAACMKSTVGENPTPLTTVNQFLGTPNFVAPEQVLNARDVDHRADIFSLGCTLFKLLTNRIPWNGATLSEKLLARTQRDAPLASLFRKDAPSRLDEIIARMLARRPDQRFSSAREVADSLQTFAMSAERTVRAPCVAPSNPAPPPAADTRVASQADLERQGGRKSVGMQWRLERSAPAGSNESHLLCETDQLVLGRAADCDLQVKDPKASRRHCRLTYQNASWLVEDLGSNNGTLVNGVPVRRIELKQGDELQLGATTLTLVGARHAPLEGVAEPVKPLAATDHRVPKIALEGGAIQCYGVETIHAACENDTSHARPIRRRIRFGRQR